MFELYLETKNIFDLSNITQEVLHDYK